MSNLPGLREAAAAVRWHVASANDDWRLMVRRPFSELRLSERGGQRPSGGGRNTRAASPSLAMASVRYCLNLRVKRGNCSS